MTKTLKTSAEGEAPSNATTTLAVTKRHICNKCHRPSPRACICEALPDEPLILQKCTVVALQHPHEARRKNRSLPLVELCLNNNDSKEKQLHTVVARRFGKQVMDPNVMALLKKDRDVLLVFPGKDAVSLEQGLEQIHQRRIDRGRYAGDDDEKKITVLVLDGTWKYAREMDQANVSEGQYPDHVIRVVLRPNKENDMEGSSNDDDVSSKKINERRGRFDIRTPPSANHLSTAECIARVLSVVEGNPSVYTSLMKPLDLMVDKWRSFSDNRSHKCSFTDGDGHMNNESSQAHGKQRKEHVGI